MINSHKSVVTYAPRHSRFRVVSALKSCNVHMAYAMRSFQSFESKTCNKLTIRLPITNTEGSGSVLELDDSAAPHDIEKSTVQILPQFYKYMYL